MANRSEKRPAPWQPNLEIGRRRLFNQRLAGRGFQRPAEAVAWLGAVQAQDFAGAKWALGQRLQAATDAEVEQAFNQGAILRTHPMRPTWHFVVPADIRWLLALTGARVAARNAYRYRQLELDAADFRRSQTTFNQALAGGRALTREELRAGLHQAGLDTQGQRMAYLLMHAELDGLICSGPRRGKQFTYMLLEERVPPAALLERDQALAELLRRYFQSHGPATVHDFVWWSELTVADARRGLEGLKGELASEVIDGRAYWFSAAERAPAGEPEAAYLLPNYDECGSYKDRGAFFDPARYGEFGLSHALLLNGRVAGSWRRTLKKDAIVIETDFFEPPTPAERSAVAAAAERYGAFLGLQPVLEYT